MEITSVHWDFIAKLACEQTAQLYVPIYPLAPEHSCEDTFSMLLTLYKDIIAPTLSTPFTVMGDSAGGGIALSFAMLLRDHSLPQPDHIILLSPGLQLTKGSPSEEARIHRIDKSDPLLSYSSLSIVHKWWSGTLPPNHYFINPTDGDLHNLGKLTILTGTRDILSVFCDSFIKKCKKNHIPVTYYRFNKMIHCWIFLPTKEGRDAVKLVYKALNS